jgi:hypothetical protein
MAGYDHTVNERQRRQTLRDRADGIVKVTVKVPKDAADLIRKIAASIRVNRQLAQPSGLASLAAISPEDDTP